VGNLNVELVTPQGAAKVINISKFPAVEGWKIQEQFLRFAVSENKAFRRDYVFLILSYAKVVQKDGGTLPLSTDALIDNHIGSVENIRELFEEILIYNGIDPQTHAKRLHYWATSGEEMASSFMAAVFRSPYIQHLKKNAEWKM
jgi:hypothetical protein